MRATRGYYSMSLSIASWTCASTTSWTPRPEDGTGSPNWPGSTLPFALTAMRCNPSSGLGNAPGAQLSTRNKSYPISCSSL